MSNRHRVIDIWGRDAGLAMAQAAGSVDAPDWRGVLEGTTSAVTQCNNVIGRFQHKMPCYICGLPILAQEKVTDENRPECEHILPVAEARWYLDLFSTSHASDEAVLKLEYAYAHRVCNQAKRDDSFITNQGDSVWKIEFDLANTKTILNNIKARASAAVVAWETVEKILAQISSMNVAERSEVIRREKIEPILQEVNSKDLTREDIITQKFSEERLTEKVKKAFQAYNKDPVFVERKKKEREQADAFYQDNDVLRLYDGMILVSPFNDLDKPAALQDGGAELKQAILTMMVAKKSGLLQDWFSILFFTAADKAGIVNKNANVSVYYNAFEYGRRFVEFRIKLEAYKLLPYVSENTRKNLGPVKCKLLDYFRLIQQTYNDRDKQDFKLTLKRAGIFIRDDEINEVITYSDIVLCKKISAEEVTVSNRLDSELRRTEFVDEEGPDDNGGLDDDGRPSKFTEDEVFLQETVKTQRAPRGPRRPASASAAIPARAPAAPSNVGKREAEGAPVSESKRRTLSLGGKTARRSRLSKTSRRTRRRHRNRSKGFGKQTYRRRLIK